VTASGNNDRLVTFVVRVEATTTNGTQIQNTALLDVPIEPAANETLVSNILTVFSQPELNTSTKVVSDLSAPVGVWEPGDSVLYLITVTNSGNQKASVVTVSDNLPAGLTFVSADSGGVFNGTTVDWDLGVLNVSGTQTVTFTATINTPLDNGTLISNSAVIDCAERSPFTTPVVSFTITSAPILVVSKIDEHSSSPYRPGDSVTYRIAVRNDGNMVAHDVSVMDTTDVSLSAIAPVNGVFSGGTITWNRTSDARLSDIAPGAANTVELVFSAQINTPLLNGTVITNQATVTPAGFASVLSDDPDLGGTSDPTSFSVTSQATLTFTKSVEDLSTGTPYSPGDTIRYHLIVTAGGDSPLRDLVLSDLIDSNLTNIVPLNGSLSGSDVLFSSTTESALALLNPGESLEFIIDADIVDPTADGTNVINQARAASADLVADVLSDGDAGSAGAQSTDFSVVSIPGLSLTKTVTDSNGDGEFRPGEIVQYEIIVRNTGSSILTNVQVDDVVDSNLSIQTNGGASQTGQSLTWSSSQIGSFASLARGAEVTLGFSAEIVLPLDNGTLIGNQATANAAELGAVVKSDDPGLGGTEDITEFVVTSAPLITAFNKTVADLTDDALVTRPGDALRYTLVFRNDGDANATNVVISDVVDVNLTVSVPANASLSGGVLTWDKNSEASLALLAPGSEVTLSFDATVAAPLANGTIVSNQASFVSTEIVAPILSDDPATALVADATLVTVVSASDLGASVKVVTNLAGTPITSARPGEIVRYVITVENRGDMAADNVVVSDLLAPELSVVDVGGAQQSAGTLIWSSAEIPGFVSMAPGDLIELVFSAQLALPLDHDLVVANQAVIMADGLASPVLTDADPGTVSKEETTIRVVSAPDLSESFKIFVDPATNNVLTTVEPGQDLRVIIGVVNTGDATAKDVHIEDVLDTSLLENITAVGGSFDGTKASWVITSVEPGISNVVLLEIEASMISPLDPGVLSNQAFVGVGPVADIPTDDPAQPGDEDPTVISIGGASDLSTFTKVISGLTGGQAEPGQTLTYTMSLQNTGNANASNVLIADTLPPEVEFVSGSATVGGVYSSATHSMSWDVGSLAGDGGEVAVSVDVKVKSLITGGTLVSNQAFVSADGVGATPSDDPNTADVDDPTNFVVDASPVFGVFTKEVERIGGGPDGMLRPGDRLRYTLKLSNEGNALATDVEIRDTLPAGKLIDPEQVSGFWMDGDTLVFDESQEPALGVFLPGDTITLIFIATVADGVSDGDVISNQASVSCAEAKPLIWSDDPTTAAVDDPTSVVIAYPDLQISKSWLDVNGGDVEPDDVLEITLTVKNTGTFGARNVVVSDTLDASLSVVDFGGGSLTDQTINFNFASLAPGESKTITFSVSIDGSTLNGTEILNHASVSYSGLTAVESNIVSVSIVARPAFDDSTKELLSESRDVAPEDEVSYRLTIVNNGKAPASDVVITDTLDANLEAIVISDGGTRVGDSIVWNIGVLPVGESVELEFSAKVSSEVANGTLIPNQALISSVPEAVVDVPTDDPATAEEDDATTIIVMAEPDFGETSLRVEDLNGGSVQPGDRLRFVLDVYNNGAIASQETRARLATPGYTNYVRGSVKVNGVSVADAADGSPLVAGQLIESRGSGSTSGVISVDDGLPPDGERAEVTFELQVDSRALPGTVISTQVLVESLDGSPTLSDNPETPEIAGDPTIVVVGGGSELAVSKTATVLADHAPRVGDQLRYEIIVSNVGDAPAISIELEDELPVDLSYVAGSLRLDGLSMTDSADEDAAEAADDRWIHFTIESLAPGASIRASFDAQILEGPVVVNQAKVSSGGRLWLSDGNSSLPGAQATKTLVGDGQTLVELAFEGKDSNGGVVDPSDRLLFELTAANEGSEELFDVEVHIEPPDGLSDIIAVAHPNATLLSEAPPVWLFDSLLPGEVIQVRIEGKVA
ncbi:DUF11 domain-containing protein, partial [Myxococcota bacterium]|nr:DUF11 domain-containing protein [Myxococcota bacterium]